MLHIFINSYTCCPDKGSEPGMGWNWITSLAKYCEIFVVSEGEYRPQVEEWLAKKENEALAGNMHFYWNPVTEKVRKMCWNQGDWRFYKYYRDWQKKTAEIAVEICKKEKIDILHQLNMIGFREPGYLAEVSKLTGIPLVWGPMGGMKQFPLAYANGWKMNVFCRLKNLINILQIRFDQRVNKTLRQADVLISAIPDTNKAIKNYHNLDSVLIPETGCTFAEEQRGKSSRFEGKDLNVIWVGKFDYRKRLDIAIRAIAKADNPHIYLKIFGSGNDAQAGNYKKLVEELRMPNLHVDFMGNRSHEEVISAMHQSDLFLFTSVSEDTSTVVLEAIGSCLPVLCFDTCGMSAVVDETVGHKIKLTNPQQSVIDFADWLSFAYQNRKELIRRAEGCLVRRNELSWDSKAQKVVKLYRQAIEKKASSHA